MDRLVLTALLLDSERTLTAQELSVRVWGPDAPATWPDLLRDYLKKVRHHLKVGTEGADALLPRHDGGYRLVVPRSRVDVHRFDDGVAAAVKLTGRDDAGAMELYRAALAEWPADSYGPGNVELLAGLPGAWAEDQRAALWNKHKAAFISYAKIGLRLSGQEQHLIPALSLVLDADPLDEQLVELLMGAYALAGRRGDALELFDRTRRRLADELGADPRPSLEELRRRILDEEPDLIQPSPSSTSLGATMPATGEHDDLDQKTKTLRELAQAAAHIVVDTSRQAPTGTQAAEGRDDSDGAVLIGRLRAHFAGDAPAEVALARTIRDPDDANAVSLLKRAIFSALLRDPSFAEDVRRLAAVDSDPAGTETRAISATTIGTATVFNDCVQVSGDFTINGSAEPKGRTR
ncbi:bacterial transcriptional activator domain-containing protein [Actinomadura sp. KC216]|uniref:AfsR/SARP family transcriptional regulator n=1 Tax=Actinomadura sp. KC216 TaxID=2530370 RepID=UPI0014049EEB|nr:bacterial transcriptional activator domain-containing protein [Actinomadura sp. KC216]